MQGCWWWRGRGQRCYACGTDKFKEPTGAIKVATGALAAEERVRTAAADGLITGFDRGKRMEAPGQGVSFSEPGCLVTFVGVERVLGAPFRVIDGDAISGKADLEWLRARVGELSQEIMRLYAYLGLESVDVLARGMIDDPLTFGLDVPTIHEPQIQSVVSGDL